ncbi:fluoride efflux transporter CrcB [Halorhabdus sp. CUG00001]|uniref:fluoride efflux transporter CrcB n=1 Tax=Halorhabdus sp. CUG00001 TaxID=2600297 RepID=UPI00131ED030|nr:fluoride efflux transporter CrcB [Halorhabdus sp. CUG00001]
MSQPHPLKRVEPLVLIAIGGFAGAILRYALSAGLPTPVVGTLVANALGSFGLGIVLYEKRLADLLSTETRLLVGTGFLSSFTTYSTFAVQTAGLSPTWAVGNILANYALGIAGVLAGRAVSRGLVA